MKRPLLVAGLCLVVVGLGAIGVRHESKAELQRALASFRANLPPDARFEYDRAYPRFFARGAGFDNARFIRGDVTLTARLLTVNNPSGYLTTGLSFSKIHAESITLAGPVSGKIGELTLNKLLLPPVTREKHNFSELPPLSQIHFHHGQIRGLALGTPDHCSATLSGAALENFGHDDGNAATMHEAHFVCASDSLPAQKLHDLFKLPAAQLGFDLEDLHESGVRYARIVAWAEDLSRQSDPGKVMPLGPHGDFSEIPSRSEGKNVGFTLIGVHFKTEALSSRQWKEGDKRLGEATLDHTVITFSSPYPLAPFLPDGIHIDKITHHGTIDTRTDLAATTVKGETPRSFGFEWSMNMQNASAPDQKHEPSLLSLNMTYRDDASNLDDLLSRFAAMRNQPLAQFKSTLTLPLALLTQKAPGLDAVPAFMLAPSGHSVTISFQPPEPLSVTSLKSLAPRFSADPAMAQRWLAPPILSSSMK
ncbi:hypothetical protein ABHV46_09960 [Asaia sp. BMEF1]|uniref:hypothetical protein n=1 Tax=Asaia sp. BMEF1 TaxID=3155932 RepID=UPI003F661AC9